MKRKTGYILAGLLVLGLLFSIKSFANTNLEEIKLDNQYLQTYRGSEGIWIVPNRVKESVGDLVHNFGTTEHEIKRVNGIPDNERIPVNEPVFFPYNDNFTRSLLLEDKGREILRTDQREFIWPISFKHSFVTSRLGRRWNAMHSGVDIACPTGSIVIAAADGVVLESKKDGGYGNKILLSHPGINQINTLYAHNSLLYVKEGDKVKKGQIIALSGNTGHTTGPHLHFEVRYQNVVLNPEHYLPVFQSSSEGRVAIARETIEP
ncbi:peptidase M23 [Leptospira tipperaryensis]|uniref:Peptidase M23 n=1 Tax=Leptospira tipperaryensis TaxID=2564040 RepID=A0A1D7V2K1_9LEPT|nr:M23 family metallopeptidase [Leptospira tipperaryensis]AOP36058.1 peptidase M23 [Leptospira tipperaryensis]